MKLLAFLLSEPGVLTVEPVFYEPFWVNLINDPISVLLDTGRKHDKLVVLAHLTDEFFAEWTQQEVGVWAILNVVDQGLVQIQNESVTAILRGLWR